MAQWIARPTLDIESDVERIHIRQVKGEIKTATHTATILVYSYLTSCTRAWKLDLRCGRFVLTLCKSKLQSLSLLIERTDKTEHTLASTDKNLTEMQKCERKIIYRRK